MDSRLEEFEKKLYKKEEGGPGKQKSYEVYKEADSKKPKVGWEKGERRRGARIGGRDITVLAGILFFSAAVAFGYYLYYSSGNTFDKKNVNVDIAGPEIISAGDQASFSVTYRNNTKLNLKDAEVLFVWPDKTILENQAAQTSLKEKAEFGLIVPHQEKNAIFKGRIFGSPGEEKEIKAVFRYAPEGFNSLFEETKTIKVKIAAAPLALAINAPAQVVSGKDVDIALEYQNQSDAYFPNMAIKITYPAGFALVAANPPPTLANNAVWQLGTVRERSSGVIKLKGNFSGAQGEPKPLYVELGSSEKEDEFIVYATASSATTIASSALFVFQTVNNSRDFVANPGTILQYKIRYKNTTDTQIPNAVILANIDSALVDMKSLNIQWGAFDSRTNSLIWNGRSVPALQVLDPKEEGEVSFSLNAKPSFLPKNFSDKNLAIASSVKITSSLGPENPQGLPIDGEDQLSVKINTQFSFNGQAYYLGGPLSNGGPIPPKVGQKTTYAISWQLSNTTNDVDDIEATAVLPPDIEWTGAVFPQDAPITFDKVTGTVTWKPSKVFAGTGVLLPVERVDFQVSFTPSFMHVGQPVNLVSGALLTATDMFTGTVMERQVPVVTSSLLNTLKSGEGTVTQ
ncbi:hypothetical protein A2988_02795 [Candidatus Azambacteria bacterium RIFCSPLOWO2_01_FULL_46_25]|uniref:DUF11 domain-containing protein n=1 Tax=Candidatus Azambacteria bacterium RIFCSPLOWO2_01_FULL_46_25 TaxID=1797298 RepID=A0A1F5BUY9_9BACT|nr:MAG: hypothetical protein A2988_02795 [Candidatus Azambacteria bacterium RIFCSPLOWO2_01_FULL_46_25]OGD37295.1 MAG: hypothetical protein A2850_01095 [Candidatus Azambacteria bacterium RIFCSPHIGHO2_01_FULL_51_74]